MIRNTLYSQEEMINQVLSSSEYILLYLECDKNITEDSFKIINHEIPDTKIFENSFLFYIDRLFDLFNKTVPLQIGCCIIDYTPLIRYILPYINRYYQKLRYELPKTLLLYIDDLNDYMEKYEKIFGKIPSNLEESEQFVRNLRSFDKYNIDGGELYYSLNNRVKNISILLDLLKNVDIPQPDDIDKIISSLKDRKENLFELIGKCVENKEQELQNFKFYLNSEVESLRKLCEVLSNELSNTKYWDITDENIISIIVDLDIEYQKSKEYNKREDYLMELEDLFENVSLQREYDYIDNTISTSNNLLTLWKLYNEFNAFKEEWLIKKISDIDFDKYSLLLHNFRNTMDNVTLKDHVIYKKLNIEFMQYEVIIPLIKELCVNYLEERHWDSIREDLKSNKIIHPYQLSSFIGIASFNINEIKLVVKLALIENQMKTKLESIEEYWNKEELEYYNEGNIKFIKEYKNIWKLEHDKINLESILNANNLWLDETRRLIVSLKYLIQILPLFYEVQEKILFLLQLFQSEQFIMSCPELIHLWDDILSEWKEIIKMFRESTNIFQLSLNISILPHLLQQREKCKSIYNHFNDYLDKLKQKFSRLCFLSDNDLLRLLSWNGNMNIVQDLLLCCYSSIRHIDYTATRNGILIQITDGKDENGKLIKKDKFTDLTITSVSTYEGYHFLFDKPIEITDEIDKWCIKLDNAIHDQLKDNLIKYIKDSLYIYSTEDFLAIPPQIRMIIQSTKWFNDLELLMPNRQSPRGEKKWLDFLQINKLDKNRVIYFLLYNLLPIPRYVAECYLLQLLNEENIIDMISKDEIFSVNHYKYLSLLKYKHSVMDECYLTMFTVNIKYGYELCGLCPRLILTPLTEKVLFTIFMSVKNNIGCTVIGERRFGRRHLLYSLSQMCGRLFIDYYCDQWKRKESVSYILNGSVATGGWCLFHNITALSLECQSYLISQTQILKLLYTRKNNNLDYSAYTFINPELKPSLFCTIDIIKNEDYYNKLVQDIYMYFRPITIIKPDMKFMINKICKISGFNGNLTPDYLYEVYDNIINNSLNITTKDTFSISIFYDIINSAITKLPLSQIPLTGLDIHDEWINVEYYSNEDELKAAIESVREFTEKIIPIEDYNIIDTVSRLFEKKYLNVNENIENKNIDAIQLGYNTIVINNSYQAIDKQYNGIVQLHNNLLYSNFVIVTGEICCGKSFVVKTLNDICNLLHNANNGSTTNFYPKVTLKTLPVLQSIPSIIIGQTEKGSNTYGGYLMNIFQSNILSGAEIHSRSKY